MVAPTVTVTFIGPAPDPAYAVVSVSGAQEHDSIVVTPAVVNEDGTLTLSTVVAQGPHTMPDTTMHVALGRGETAQQAAARWALAAYGVTLTPPEPTPQEQAASALRAALGAITDPAVRAALELVHDGLVGSPTSRLQ